MSGHQYQPSSVLTSSLRMVKFGLSSNHLH